MRKVFILLIATLLVSCATTIRKSGDNQSLKDSVRACINYFRLYSPIYNEDSVFEVRVMEKGKNYIVEIYQPQNYIQPLFRDSVGAIATVFPTYAVVLDGRLFYCYMPQPEQIDRKNWELYEKYNMIDTTWWSRWSFGDNPDVLPAWRNYDKKWTEYDRARFRVKK